MKAFFIFVLLAMISVTTWASFDQNVVEGFKILWREKWGIATLFDTYFSFTMIYFWIYFHEKKLLQRIVWFLAVYAFGTIAIALYFLVFNPQSLQKFIDFKRNPS